MEWTKEAPTEPGWYWCYDRGDIEIIEVEIASDGEVAKVIYYRTGHAEEWYPHEMEWCYWQGPFPVPEKPEGA